MIFPSCRGVTIARNNCGRLPGEILTWIADGVSSAYRDKPPFPVCPGHPRVNAKTIRPKKTLVAGPGPATGILSGGPGSSPRDPHATPQKNAAQKSGGWRREPRPRGSSLVVQDLSPLRARLLLLLAGP